jgi:hypothetical protein
MLLIAMLILGAAVALGLYLGSLLLMDEKLPARMIRVGWVHGGLGALGVGALLLALRGPARGVAQGAGSFGWTSGIILTVTLAGGLTILILHLIRRKVSPLLIAMHGTLGVAGYVLLAAYFASPASFGR